MDTFLENNHIDGTEIIRFMKVDIERKDKTFYQEHIEFFVEHLGTEDLLFFTSEDVKYLGNFEFLRTMNILEKEKINKFTDIDFNDIFFLSKNDTYFHGLDVCLILNGAVDVLIVRKVDIKGLQFILEKSEMTILVNRNQ